jgi:hypothetical protein
MTEEVLEIRKMFTCTVQSMTCADIDHQNSTTLADRDVTSELHRLNILRSIDDLQ